MEKQQSVGQPKSCICYPKNCTSCKYCYYSCKNNNIVMKDEGDGFLKPYIIDLSKCDGCNNVCPQTNIKKHPKHKAIALQLLNKKRLINSTSGGAFDAISKYVFDHNGVVYAAVYDSELNVIYKRYTSYNKIEETKGSKYVQSDLKNVYKTIKNDVANNYPVLFVGLPCQVNAILHFCDYSKNLITCDLVCSGVPSPTLFKSFIDYENKKNHIKIKDYKFRDKHKYGLSHTSVISYKQGIITKRKTVKNRDEISYYVAFGKQNCYMDSCYSCSYTVKNRVSDFTLGGFWNINKVNTSLNVKLGISLVLVNSDMAENIINYISSHNIARVENHDYETSIRLNPAIYETTSPQKQCKDIYLSLSENGYYQTSLKYFAPCRKQRLTIKRLIKKVLKKMGILS